MAKTQIFDDGSTLTTDDNGNPIQYTESNQTQPGFTPASVNPGASTWDQVLQNGFSRLIDAKVRAVTPTNTIPVMQGTGTVNLGNVGAINLRALLPVVLLAGVAFVAYKAFVK